MQFYEVIATCEFPDFSPSLLVVAKAIEILIVVELKKEFSTLGMQSQHAKL